MTEVLLVCSKDGSFKSCRACGHSGFASKGKDIVCAAESIVLRTAIEVLNKTKGIKCFTDASSRGNLAFWVEDTSLCSADFCKVERLKCTADFIRAGILSLAQEYPKNVQLREMTEA